MKVPGYQIERLVAEGGMSTVYRAVQASLGRPVTLKVLKHIDSLQHAERFLREARIVAALEHRNIVTIHDVGSVDERYYIAMEYLDGASLADRIEHGLPASEALDLVEAIAGCLDFVHRRGVVHRDIKPSNILFHADGTPKLSDFGIAKELGEEPEGELVGSCFGSPYYLSPEQAEGRPLDGRSDIYSLGIVFYQMLTGRKPYVGNSHIETIVAHLSYPIPALPEHLARYQRLLEDMIAKDPADRIASAAELLDRIRALRAPEAPAAAHGIRVAAAATRAGRAPLPAALVLLALAALAGWWSLGGEGDDPAVAAVAASDSASESDAAQPDPAPSLLQPPPVVDPEPTAQVASEAGVVADPAPPAPADLGLEAIASPPGQDAGDTPALAGAEAGVPAGLAGAAPAQTESSDLAAADTGDPEADAAAAAPSGESAEAQAAEAQTADDGADRIDALMRQAEADLRALRLTRPPGRNAHDRYREVLGLEPGHPGALAGIDAIAARYAVMAQEAIAKGERDRAGLYLKRGNQLRPGHPDLVAAEQALADSEPAPVQPEPAVAEVVEEPVQESLRGPGSGNMVKDFQKLWRSVFE